MSAFPRPAFVFAALVAAAVPLAAQIQGTLHTDTIMIVNHDTQSQSAPAGQDISNGLTLDATASTGWGRLTVTFESSPTTGLKYVHQTSLRASSPTKSSTGPHSTRMVVRSPTPVTGNLRLKFFLDLGFNVSHSVLVDIDDDGSIDFTHQTGQIVNIARTIDPQRPLVIRTTEQSFTTGGTGTAQGGGALTIEFRPIGPCTYRGIGAGCGPTLTVRNTFTPNTFQADLAGGPPAGQGAAILLLGFNRLQFQWPGTSCFLWTDAPLFVNLALDAGGNATFTHTLRTQSHVVFNLQAVTADFTGTPALFFSNAVEATCN
jgi:hypothetical protein